MKKIYQHFGLEIHLIIVGVVNFLSFLVPISYKVLSDNEKITEYGFNIFGSISLILLTIVILLLFLKKHIPQKLTNLWRYLLGIYDICLFINLLISMFYAIFICNVIYKGQYEYIVGNGYLAQLVGILIAYLHSYNVFNNEYILFEESSIKKYF